jgi:hypothetical protein
LQKESEEKMKRKIKMKSNNQVRIIVARLKAMLIPSSITGALILLILFFSAGPAAFAGSCTQGVDCYCDRAKANDPLTLMCEDFDHPLYRDEGTANTSPGPWWADATQPGNRGVSSLWRMRYGNFASGANWSLGSPSSPKRGTPCAFSQCSGGPVYHPLNLYGSGGNLFMVATGSPAGDFNSEVSTLSAPSGKAGGGSGHFDGNASIAFRNGPGTASGILGTAAFAGGARQTFGITAAMAYPTNLLQQSGGIIQTAARTAWKHNEFRNGAGYAADGLFTFVHSSGWNTSWAPFYGFMTGNRANPVTYAQCESARLAASKPFGTFSCNNNNGYGTLIWFATNYNQPTD